jgi:ribosome maturation factor RimP
MPDRQQPIPPHHAGALATRFRLGYLTNTIILRCVTGGGLNWPPFLFLDDNPASQRLETRLAETVTPTLEGMGYELVRVTLIGRDRPTVQVMADRADGAPIAVADCESISHALGAVLDVADLVPGAWTLEVSSPGIDRPLTRPKDWNRFAGHLVRAESATPIDGRKRFSGIVLGADNSAARMRLDDGTEVMLPWHDIRRARLVLTDALIAATAQPARTN